jgi:hypothetical protein
LAAAPRQEKPLHAAPERLAVLQNGSFAAGSGLSSGSPQFVGELREGHRLTEPVFDREVQIFADQSPVDGTLIRLDDGVGIGTSGILHALILTFGKINLMKPDTLDVRDAMDSLIRHYRAEEEQRRPLVLDKRRHRKLVSCPGIT